VSNPPNRDSFDDLPILAELRELLDDRFNQGRRRGSAGRRWAVRSLSAAVRGIPVALAVLVVVAVAVVALTLGSHDRSRTPIRTTDAVPAKPPAVAKLPLGAPAGPQTASPNKFQGAAIPSTVGLVAETRDPHGGLPWALREFQTTRGQTCLQVGRIQDGTIGVIGQDGAWGNDHRFHPISPNAYTGDSCGPTDAHGAAFNNVAVQGGIASADVPWGAGAQGGECRIGAQSQQFPTCPPADLRDLDYGLLGPEAATITYAGTNGRLFTEPTNGPNGAYLIVRAGGTTSACSQQPGGGRSCVSGGGRTSGASLRSGVITSVAYRDGHVCRLPAPTSAGVAQASCPPVRASTPTGPQTRVRVKVTPANRHCTSRLGETLEPCPNRPRGLVRLGGPSSQWLVIFSFRAPTSTVAAGRTYYYFTADTPGRCPNANQFGEYNEAVRKDQQVVQWSAFDKHCPGAGHGTISLITSRTARHSPGQGASRPIASFNFRIP
jgi:hypothetical protein